MELTGVDTIREKLFELQKRYYELPPESDLTETDEAREKMETSLEEIVFNLRLTNHPPLRFDHLIQLINISTFPPLRNDHSVFTLPSDDIVEMKLPN
ncbi:hypothetical protein AVEN_149381-1 [Araneus ventricosus]|uniref:Uncharacterized protein n=1 Tax=Araneus ventricosus TaxID=182803 RepID=A0A4Y2RZC7_ARAVE|nr:hypothetical protein AVEN_149381-1 [Araneus ventricosus]